MTFAVGVFADWRTFCLPELKQRQVCNVHIDIISLDVTKSNCKRCDRVNVAEGLSTGSWRLRQLRSGTGSGQLCERFFGRLPRPGLALSLAFLKATSQNLNYFF